MTFRGEFEKAYKGCAWNEHSNPHQVALWAAKFTIDEIIKTYDLGKYVELNLLKLKKELS